MVGRSLVALLMLCALVAGCSSKAEGPPTETGLAQAAKAADQVAVKATATTGVIRGIVVDSAIKPLANVSVSLVGRATQVFSNLQGAFGFEHLAPGSYFLLANKTGYVSTQVAVEVVAEDSNPVATKILMANDPRFVRPYVQEQQFKGFIGCTSSAIAACSLPNSMCEIFGCGNVTDDRYFFQMRVDPHPAFAQSEWVWDAVVPTNQYIDFYMEAGDGCASKFFNATGSHASPSYVTVEGSGFGDPTSGSGQCGVSYRAFGGTTEGAPCPQGVCAGVIVQQPFTLYLHTFYGYKPPLGWRFTDGSGTPQPPA